MRWLSCKVPAFILDSAELLMAPMRFPMEKSGLRYCARAPLRPKYGLFGGLMYDGSTPLTTTSGVPELPPESAVRPCPMVRAPILLSFSTRGSLSLESVEEEEGGDRRFPVRSIEPPHSTSTPSIRSATCLFVFLLGSPPLRFTAMSGAELDPMIDPTGIERLPAIGWKMSP